jgi:hypothetical protein
MPSSRSSKAKRASATDPELLARTEGRPPPPRDLPREDAGNADATGRDEQRQAVEQAMARQNVRLTSSPGAIGPIGRTVLLIALFALVGLIAVWFLLAL